MALVIEDFFDPNTWIEEDYEYRIYGDDNASIYAVVDEIDYHYLINWKWRPKTSKVSKGTIKPKVYLCRSGHETIGEPSRDERGNRVKAARRQSTIFLHTVVAERAKLPIPITNKKIIVDHADGDGFNCRRKNLRYTTLSFNRMNIFGCHERFLV